MGIEERLKQRTFQRRKIEHLFAVSDILLVIAAAAFTSIFLPIRSQYQNLANLEVILLLQSLVLIGISLPLLAVSDWEPTVYGRALGGGLLGYSLIIFLMYGSWTIEWIVWTLVILFVAIWHIWIARGINHNKGSDVSRSDEIGSVDPPDIVATALIVVSGVIVFWFASSLSPLMRQAADFYTLTPIVGFIIIIYALVRQIGYRMDTSFAVFLVAWVFIWIFAMFITSPDFNQFGTDAILFAQYGADLILQGANPYVQSMAPAFERYPIDSRYLTYRIDGSTVQSYSYPGASLLIFTAGALLGIPNLNWVSLIFFLAILIFFIIYTFL